MQRVQKLLAERGVDSRRNCEELIRQGRVRVNNTVIKLGDQATEDDKISVDGILIKQQQKVYYMLNKPRGYVSAVKDQFKKTVLDLLNVNEKVFPVGRLDEDAEGLLMFTNDGDLANRVMHPRYETNKTYIAQLDRRLQRSDEKIINAGMRLKDGKVNAQVKTHGENVEVTLHEGRHKIVKRIFNELGYRVHKLKRIETAGITLGNLKLGKYRRLTQREVQTLFRNVK